MPDEPRRLLHLLGSIHAISAKRSGVGERNLQKAHAFVPR